ncbi:hypothetical protein GSI_12590 [Ganoderma sinense ZZ0214-1]|uniref:F-box domain-containing protein n=1 Tax=Ganoderma sinense ZZ0214-1 TaxID=1077348 RepID=A0A2G8RT93_9APHY|nr:hypothetical protein GSI_12590 [Ganoderma sinense ZZ0214-1]
MRSRSHRLSRRANAGAFPTLPPILKLHLDVVALICDHLHPTDVLSLSRTCKEIHRFLHVKPSRWAWRAAFRNVEGLPACPKWLPEPQYATLCFEEFCTRCLATDPASTSSLWPFGVRYCLPCRNAMLTAKPFKNFPDVATLGLKLRATELFPGLLTGPALSKKVLSFHVPEVEKLRKDVTKFIGNGDQALATTSIRTLLDEKTKNTKERLEFALECKRWMYLWRREQERIAHELRLKRRQDVFQKLELLGYSNEVRDLGLHQQGLTGEVLAFVQQARALNDREWNMIRPVFVTFMEDRRVLGGRVTYIRLLRSRLRLLQLKLFAYLHEGDRKDKRVGGARMFPTVLDLLDVKDAAYLVSLPEGALLMPHFWPAHLPGLIDAWERGRGEVLLSLLHKLEDSSSSTGIFAHGPSVHGTPTSVTTRSVAATSSSPLSHPAALFWCNACMSLVSGVIAFSHACCYGRADHDHAEIFTDLTPLVNGRFSQVVTTSDSNHSLFEKTVVAFSDGILPWSPEHLHGCVPVVRSILRACGVELQDLPREIQKVASSRFACTACSQVGKSVLAMGWLRAVSHAFEVHEGQEGSWVRLPHKLEEKAKHVEYTSVKIFTAELDAHTRWECSRCAWDVPQAGLAYTWPQLVNHFNVYHPMTLLGPMWYRPSEDTAPFMYPAVHFVTRGAEGEIDDDIFQAFPRRHLFTPYKLAADTWVQLGL